MSQVPGRVAALSLTDTELPLLARTPEAVRRTGRWLPTTFLVGALGLLIIPWQQTAFAPGKVQIWAPGARQQLVEAPVQGRIVRWHVREGDRVKAGDLLVSIADNDPLLLDRLRDERSSVVVQRDASEARIRDLEARRSALANSRDSAADAAEQRVTAEQDRLTAAQETLAVEEAAALAAAQNLERTRALHKDGLRSDRDLELAIAAADAAVAAVARANANARVAAAQLAAVRSDRDALLWRTDADISAVDAELQNAIQSLEGVDQRVLQLDARVARQENQEVRAPFDALVAKIHGGEGAEQVREGDRLVELIPAVADRAVELTFAGVDAPLVREGQEVRLQFEGFPALQVSGWPMVSRGTFAGTVSFVDAAADGKGQVRAIVTPTDPAEWPAADVLRQNSKVKGWTMLSTVPLGYELWRQLNGFPASLDPVEKELSDDPAKKPEAGKAWRPK